MKLGNFFYISGMKVLDYLIKWDYISNMFHALAGVSINEASCGYRIRLEVLQTATHESGAEENLENIGFHKQTSIP
jgi:hypothetical protein